MYSRIINWILVHILSENHIDEENAEIYYFGLECMLLKLVHYTSYIFIGILLHYIAYLLVFLMLLAHSPSSSFHL